jgi:putative heme-binding domain-containing protein
LTTINKKFDKAGLTDAIINPSAGVVFGYEAWTIQTKDGQSQFGFLVADGKDVVVIKDLLGVQYQIPVKDITSRTKSNKSLMPQPGDLGFTEQDVADVVRFLTEVK